MKRKCKTVAELLMVALTLGLFGCGKEPTAEELVNGISMDVLKDQSINAEVTFAFDGEVTFAMPTSISFEEEETEINAGANLTGTGKLRADKDTVLVSDIGIDGSFTGMLAGFIPEGLSEKEEGLVSCEQIEDETLVSYNKKEDVWEKEETYYDKETATDILSKLNADAFSDLQLTDKKKAYTVTGTLSLAKLQELMGEDAESLADSIPSEELAKALEEVKLTVTLTFDKKTKNLTGFAVSLKDFEKEGLVIRELSVVLSMEYTKEAVEIPDEVISNATTEETDMDIEVEPEVEVSTEEVESVFGDFSN